MASILDKFTETFNGQNPTSTTVANARSTGATTLVCTSLAGWPINTAVHFATYQKDSTGAKIAGTQIDWKGVVSGSSVNSLTRQGGATDGGNSVGDIVEMMPTYSWAQDLAKGLESQHNTDGTHSIITASSITATSTSTLSGGLTVGSSFSAPGLITFASLLATIFSGQILTQANAGTAGGTFSYVNLGGIKLLWIMSATGLVTGSTNSPYTFTLPTFFTTVTSAVTSPNTLTGQGAQYASCDAVSASSITVRVTAPGGAGTAGIGLFVIGT